MTCEKCDLGKNCHTNKMDGSGMGRPSYMIVGEAPQKEDDYAGEPFSTKGENGRKLLYFLEKAGIDADDCYLTYAVKCEAKAADIKAKHIEACIDYLSNEVVRVRPKVIIAMGKAPVQALIQQSSVKEFRGHFEKFEVDYNFNGKIRVIESQVMPTYSPNASLTKWEYDNYIIQDLKKAKAFVKTGKLPEPPKYEFKTVLDLETLDAYVERFTKAKRFTFDFETTGLQFHKDEIIIGGYCDNLKSCMVVPYFVYPEDHTKKFSDKELENVELVNAFVSNHKEKIKKALKTVHACNVKKIAHNGKFDVNFARQNNFPVKKYFWDTILSHALLDENKAHDLNSCLKDINVDFGPYDTKLWKWVNKERKSKKPYSYVPPSILWDYLAKDVIGTMYLYQNQFLGIKEAGLQDLMLNQQMKLSRVMADIEFQGCRIDIEKMHSMTKDFNAMILDIENKVKAHTKLPDLNLNSPKQLSEYFQSKNYPFEQLKIKKGKTGYSTGKDALQKFATRKKWRKLPKLILDHRGLSKVRNQYLEGSDSKSGLIQFLDEENFVHASYNLHTPRTGRLSCSNPPLQTLPRPTPLYPKANIRQLFITNKKENLIFSADYKQLELRVVAFLAKDQTMIKEIQDGVDLHTRNCILFGKTLDFIPSDMTEKRFSEIRNYKGDDNKKIILQAEFDEHRTFAKSVAFGLNYGMEARTLAEDHGREIDDVEEMIGVYFSKYGSIFEWREEVKEIALTTGILTLPETKRKRRFTQFMNWFDHPLSEGSNRKYFVKAEIHRQAMNYPVQGYANELFVKGKLNLVDEIKKNKMESRILISIHDGIIGEGPKDEMIELEKMAHKCMGNFLGEGKLKVPLLIDFELYDRWYGKKVIL